MKLFPLTWKNQTLYGNHFSLLGVFREIMGAMKMVGYKMSGSGFSKLLHRAKLVTTGWIKKSAFP